MRKDKKTDLTNVDLVSSVVCLGRAPGIRPSDVEAAIWTAVREAILV